MSEQTPVPESAAPQTEQQEEDPFAGFQSEAYDDGERVEEVPVGEPSATEEDARTAEGAEEASAPKEEAAEPPKKPQTAQERINELTKARREAERKAEDLQRRLEVLEQRVPPEQPAEPPKEEAKGPPKPEDFDFGELDSAYIAAVVDYHTERRLEEFTTRQEQVRQQAEMQAQFQQTIERGRGKYEDFEEKVIRGANDHTWPLSETLGVLLVGSDVGEDVAYYLATHPEEAASVYAQAPVEQARYFGRLEAKFSAARAAATGGGDPAVTSATTRAPKAPPPVAPGRGAGGTFQANASSDDFIAFERAAQKNN